MSGYSVSDCIRCGLAREDHTPDGEPMTGDSCGGFMSKEPATVRETRAVLDRLSSELDYYMLNYSPGSDQPLPHKRRMHKLIDSLNDELSYYMGTHCLIKQEN